MANGQNVNRLFETNNYSIVSKYSAVKCNYFHDATLEEFVESRLVKSAPWRRTPLVNRGYAARLLAIDWAMNRLTRFGNLDCMIIFGAGYDTLSFRRREVPCYLELDLPEVVQVKGRYMEEKYGLTPQQVHPGVYKFPNHYLVECDIRNIDMLKRTLGAALAGVENRKRVALVNEVCFCYLESEEIRATLSATIDLLKESATKIYYLGYEQIQDGFASNEFASFMSNHFRTLGHPLKYFPSPEQIRNLLCGLEFDNVTVASMYTIFHNALVEERLRFEGFATEPFDEYEEMDLYLGHYALVTGMLDLNVNPFLLDNATRQPQQNEEDTSQSDKDGTICHGLKNTLLEPVRRYAHSSCILQDSSECCKVFIAGGFGSEDGKHKRLAGGQMCTMNDNIDIYCRPVDDPLISTDRMHGQVCKVGENTEGNDIIFFNGGRNSPNTIKPSNVPFIAKMCPDSNGGGFQLLMMHKFQFETTENVTCWRHRLIQIDDDNLVQIGGLSVKPSLRPSPLIIWNLSTDRCGYTPVTVGDRLGIYDRHSFGADINNRLNAILVFGGLQASSIGCYDRPIDQSESVILWDFRSKNPIPFQVIQITLQQGYYGSNVHFINDYQFINICGISTATGQVNDAVQLYDLRANSRCLVASMKHPPSQDSRLRLILTNATSAHFKSRQQVVTMGGGGNYFTFGTHFNKISLQLLYNHGEVAELSEMFDQL